jgi:tetratricopeptide (TPR) repeat protein
MKPAPPRHSVPPRRRTGPLLGGLLAVLIVLALTALVQSPALTAEATYFDDEQYVTDNPRVQSPSWHNAWLFGAEVLAPSTLGSYYQPLAMISLMLDRARSGEGASLRPYHETQLALHLLATALVVLLLHALFDSLPAAALAGLLFGVHPASTEAVVWVSQRKTLLAAVFALACLLVYVRRVRRGLSGASPAALGLFAFALLSKPIAVTLPVLLLLLDLWPLRRPPGRPVLREKLPFFALAGLAAGITYLSQARTAIASPLTAANAGDRLLLALHSLGMYLAAAVWPAAPVPYPVAPAPLRLTNPAVLGGLAILAAATAAAWIGLRWTRAGAVGLAAFLVALLPTVGLIGFTHMVRANQYLYLPLLGLLIPFAAALRVAGEQSKPWLRGAAFAAALGLAAVAAFASRGYLRLWQDSETLLRGALAAAPQTPELHHNLGVLLSRQQRWDEAMPHLLAAVESKPDFPLAHYNLGLARLAQGDGPAALQSFTQALAWKPDFAPAHSSLASLLLARGDPAGAVAHLREAARLSPDDPLAQGNLGASLLQIGRTAEAVAPLRRALQLAPQDAAVHYNLGLAMARQGHTREALDLYDQALRLNPGLDAARRSKEKLLLHNPAQN